MTIEVTRLDRTLVFENRATLAQHVEELIETRGGIFDPMELACIQKLAALSNGDSPSHVKRIARASAHYTPPRPERGPSPFDARIEELEADVEARAEEHDALNARIRELEAEYQAEHRKRLAEADGNPTALARIGAWIEARRGELEDLRAERELAHEHARRARVAHNALLLRRDRWHQDHEARFVVDGREVDMAGLHEYLAAARGQR